MKKILFFILLGQFQLAGAQAQLKLDKEFHNFGEVNEMDNVFHIFTITNTGKDTLRITDIQPECGCTTPEIGTKIIAPGAETGLKVKYDAKGRIGQFSKKIALYSNTNPLITMVYISGDVKPANITGAQINRPTQDLLLNKTTIKLDTIHHQETVKFTILIRNESDKAKNILGVRNLPDGLSCINPQLKLAPKEEKVLNFEFNAALYKDFGRVVKYISIDTDDKLYTTKLILFEGFIVPYYPKPPSKQKKYNKWINTLPKAEVSRTKINYGTIATGAIVKDTVTLKNTGKDTLKIYKIYSSCACFAASIPSGEILPGQSIIITLTFDAVARKNRQLKTAYIMINDPLMKQIEFTMEAQVTF